MKSITIITGAQGSGKSNKATEIAKDWLYRILPFEPLMLSDVFTDKTIKSIIFDEFIFERDFIDVKTIAEEFNLDIILTSQEPVKFPKSKHYKINYINL